jgi:hypothetical protein
MSQSHAVSDWSKTKHGVPQGLVLRPLLFLLYVNDLSTVININFNLVLFDDNTSITVSNSNPINFKKDLITLFEQINIWFTVNLSLNFNKTHYMQFTTKNNSAIEINMDFNNKHIINTSNTHF